MMAPIELFFERTKRAAKNFRHTRPSRIVWATSLAALVCAPLALHLKAAPIGPGMGVLNVPAALSPLGVTNTIITSTAGVALRVPANSGLLLLPVQYGVNPSNMNYVVALDVSSDNVNWSNNQPLAGTNAATGTNFAIGPVTFTAAQLSPYAYVRVGGIGVLSATGGSNTLVTAVNYQFFQ